MAQGSRQGVFLDRDGVLNQTVVRNGRPYPPASASDVELIAGVEPACRELATAGALLFCVTNQPDVARGTTSQSEVDAINEVVRTRLGLAEVMACYHDDDDDCPCRKPRPGMILDLAARYAVDVGRSVMVGDRWRDIEAGERAGCRTVFIDYGYDEQRPSPDLTVSSLAEATPRILSFLRTGTF